MSVTRITSPDNERIRLYKRLYLEKRLRRKEGLFVLEGARLVSDAAGIIPFHSVFMTEEAMSRYSSSAEKIAAHTNICIITEQISDMISGTDNSQGIFAIMQSPEEKDLRLYDPKKVIILDNVQDPGNMGTMLRTADACGIDAAVLCQCCDELSPKVVRSAMGSIMRVNIFHSKFEEAVQTLKEKGHTIYSAVINGGDELGVSPFPERSSVVIGNEGSGISDEHIALTDRQLTIKMHGTVNSLNAAIAAGIIMWELSRYE